MRASDEVADATEEMQLFGDISPRDVKEAGNRDLFGPLDKAVRRGFGSYSGEDQRTTGERNESEEGGRLLSGVEFDESHPLLECPCDSDLLDCTCFFGSINPLVLLIQRETVHAEGGDEGEGVVEKDVHQKHLFLAWSNSEKNAKHPLSDDAEDELVPAQQSVNMIHITRRREYETHTVVRRRKKRFTYTIRGGEVVPVVKVVKKKERLIALVVTPRQAR